MATPGWFDGNRGRAFPFQTRTVGLPAGGPATVANLPRDAVVDAGFVTGPQSEFAADADSVYLLQVRRSGGSVYFDFASGASGLAGVVLTFAFAETAARYEQEFAEAGGQDYSASDSLSDEDCDEPHLSGFLVVGDLAALLELVGEGETLAGNESGAAGVVEPALVQNLAGAYVVGVGIANADRTHAESPEGCDAVVWPFAEDAIFVQEACVSGPVLLQAGYNAGVRQDTAAGTIVLQAALGAGAGQTCEEVPLYPGEEPPEGSDLLTGGPTCGELLRSINGLGGPRIDLKAGLGVTVTADPEAHTLVVDADFTGMAGCYTDSDTMSDTEVV